MRATPLAIGDAWQIGRSERTVLPILGPVGGSLTGEDEVVADLYAVARCGADDVH